MTTVLITKRCFFLAVTASSGARRGGFVLSAMPNTTTPVENKATLYPPFDVATWYVPSRGSSSKKVGFLVGDLANATDEVVTKGFDVMDRWVVLQERPDKFLMDLYCAFPTESSGIWSITWNETTRNAAGVPVVLKNYPAEPGSTTAFVLGATCAYDV
jgi:hypothetical protein